MESHGGTSNLSCLSLCNCSSGCAADTNGSEPQLPADMVFNEMHRFAIIGYSVLFLVSSVGNLTIFCALYRSLRAGKRSRVKLLILHLALADLIVTFVLIPLEVTWSLTVRWLAGDFLCRLMMFLRTFGLYLSSFVLVVISLDRYIAVVHPLSANNKADRGKVMLTGAWVLSAIASVPQAIIFHIERHPLFLWYEQCLTFNFFPTPAYEQAYNFFTMLAMYGLPLVIIVICYALILREINSKSRECRESQNSSGEKLRRSGVGNIERARTRTLKMSLIIVLAFVACWTPYYVMSVYFWVDRAKALASISAMAQKALFMFAVSNSCLNPIVYGLFSVHRRDLLRCFPCLERLIQAQEPSYASLSMQQAKAPAPPGVRRTESALGGYVAKNQHVRFAVANGRADGGSLSGKSLSSLETAGAGWRQKRRRPQYEHEIAVLCLQ